MEVIRNRLRQLGFSDGVVSILLGGTRDSTNAAYASAWKHWLDWCRGGSKDPLSNDLVQFIEFLAHLFKSGKSYSTINICRSSLSSTLDPIDGSNIGKHPIVNRFMRAIYNQNPPRPRYSSTWNVDTVLKLIQTWGPNECLNAKFLVKKMAILLALSTFMRTSELASIDKHSVTFHETGVSFTLTKLRKSQQTGPVQDFQLKKLPDPLLCPVSCLGFYVYSTDVLRTDENSAHLFISPSKPYINVSPTTISRWIKNVLKQAGIGSQFSAHSTRGAASSKAAANGLSILSILKKGNWAHETTFTRFYRREAHTPVVEESVLNCEL